MFKESTKFMKIDRAILILIINAHSAQYGFLKVLLTQVSTGFAERKGIQYETYDLCHLDFASLNSVIGLRVPVYIAPRKVPYFASPAEL